MSNTKKSPNAAPVKKAQKGVRFTLTGLPSGIFKQTIPEELPVISIVGGHGSFKVRHGEKIVIPAGDYVAIVSYTPPEESKVLCGSTYSKPVFDVYAPFTVKDDTANVELPITYKCFALVRFPEQADSYSIRGYDGKMRPFTQMFGKTPEQVAYLAGGFSFPALDVWASKEGGPFKAVEIVNDEAFAEGERILAKPGHWYSINPADASIDFGEIDTYK